MYIEEEDRGRAGEKIIFSGKIRAKDARVRRIQNAPNQSREEGVMSASEKQSTEEKRGQSHLYSRPRRVYVGGLKAQRRRQEVIVRTNWGETCRRSRTEARGGE